MSRDWSSNKYQVACYALKRSINALYETYVDCHYYLHCEDGKVIEKHLYPLIQYMDDMMFSFCDWEDNKQQWWNFEEYDPKKEYGE